MTKWGLSATIKASATDILDFAAYHLDLGAHRLHLYLDDPNPKAFAALKAHPKIRVITCDHDYWQKHHDRRPTKHQVRQTANATHAYRRRVEVDWLVHMDVDEFLWPDAPVSQLLAELPTDTLCARVRPIESIAGDGTAFKGFIPSGPDRNSIVDRIYPRFGRYMKGGFLSHVAGKLFVRTGLQPMQVKIHNIYLDRVMNPNATELNSMALCHCHVQNWDHWIAAYRYRLSKGSYRAELPPVQSHDKGGLSAHELFTMIEAESGEQGLRAFFDEMCADTPELRARLRAEGLLRQCDLQLNSKRRKHFPEFG